MSITILWKANFFSIGKKIYESILIPAKLWSILSVIPLLSLKRYLIFYKFYHTTHNQIILNV